MSKKFEVIIDIDAYSDLEEIINWYDSKKPDLGLEFLDEFNEITEVIAYQPETYIKYFKQFRRALLKQFPYVFYYGIDEKNKQIKIVGIYSSSRNPKIAKKRMDSKNF